MTQPHDPDITADISPVPADSSRADDTIDQVQGVSSTDRSGPDSREPAGNLPMIPGYRVLREIARGGMGRVLAAHDFQLDRDVALKILLPGANADRFVRESKITARLPHPGIPPVYALGVLDDGSPFLAMKLIAGQTLSEAMKTAGRPLLLQAFAQVCQAVGFAHSRGIIHRDLKPANVMVGAFGEVQVMDWGLAKELTSHDAERQEEILKDPGSTEDADRTRAGAVMGTPAYMAPEQARGEATDARADVFALGGILCAILTGKPPFGGKSSLEVVRRAGAADLAEANARLDDCGADAELVALCRRCLSPMPADRLSNGQAVADAMTTYFNGVQQRLQAAERERAVAVARMGEQRKRRKVQMLLAAAVIVLLLGGGAFAWYSDRQAGNRRLAEERAAGERLRIEAEGKATAARLESERTRIEAEGKETAARLEGERQAEARNKELQAQQGVTANLQLAADLRGRYRFKAAESALNQALILARSGAPNRLADVEQARRDLAFVVRLDDIRYRKWLWNSQSGSYKPEAATPNYRRAFADYKLDLADLKPEEAAKAIRASGVRAELVAAIDDWALWESEPDLLKRLLEVARRADPGPLTDRLRNPAVRNDKGALEKLEEEAIQLLNSDSDGANVSPTALSALAELMAEKKLDPRALLLAARAAHPADFELAFALAQLARKREDFAIGPYEAARALRPDNLAVWINLGGILCDLKGDLEGAITCFTKAIDLNPIEGKAHIGLGVCLTRQGHADLAIPCFRKAIEINPNDAYAHYNLGVALESEGNPDEAIACWRKSIEFDASFSSPHYDLGLTFAQRGQLDEAIACYRKAIALDPEFGYIHYNLGVAYKRKGQLMDAIASFRLSLKLEPKHAKGYVALGTALAGDGQLDEAISCYRRAIDLSPDLATAHHNLGTVLKQKGRIDEAIASYRKAASLDPDNADFHTNLGIILCDVKRDYDGAIASFGKALELNPKNAGVLFNLGVALKGKGKLDEAIDCWRKSIALNPSEPDAHHNLGTALRSKGMLDEAIACYEKALTLNPKKATAHASLASVLSQKGRMEEAVKAYREAIRLQPNSAETYCNLANTLRQMSDYAGALEMYRKGHELGSRKANWPYPTAQWVEIAERELAVSRRLPALLRGEDKPKDNAERMDFARIAFERKHFVAATRLWEEALAANPKLLDTGWYVNAARAAASAAGTADPSLDVAERAKYRKKALDWLTAEVDYNTRRLENVQPQSRRIIADRLGRLQKYSELAGIRDGPAVAGLPADERKAFEKLWADVDALRRKADAKPK